MTIVNTPHLYSVLCTAFFITPAYADPCPDRRDSFDRFTFIEVSAPHKFDHMGANILDVSIGLQRVQKQHAVSREIAVGSRRNPGVLIDFTSRERHCFFGISRTKDNPCKLGPNDLVFEAGKVDLCFYPGMRFRLRFMKVKSHTAGEQIHLGYGENPENSENLHGIHPRFVASDRLTLGPVPGHLPELWG